MNLRKIFYDILNIHKNLRRSPEAYNILLVNLLILGMVIFMKPNRYIVIAAYFFETLVIGVYNVIKMLIITFFSPAAKETPEILPEQKPKNGFSSPLKMNLFLIVFFIMHFSIFYFVQLGMLAGASSDLADPFPGSNSFIPNPFVFFRDALGKEGLYAMIPIIMMQLFALLYSFVYKGEYKVTNCVVQAVQPYGRIMLQQFVVLIGGFFIIIFRNTAVFSIILIVIKTFVDIYAQKRHETNFMKKLAGL
jgi:hypothetical protein